MRQVPNFSRPIKDGVPLGDTVKDTTSRCRKDFERNPNIKNHGGYILSAIEKDYFKKERNDQQLQAQKEASEKANIKRKQNIEKLVQEGKTSFATWRKPFIRKLRVKFLNDSIVQSAIDANAKDARYHKVIKDHAV